jgi:hypothetical protein
MQCSKKIDKPTPDDGISIHLRRTQDISQFLGGTHQSNMTKASTSERIPWDS